MKNLFVFVFIMYSTCAFAWERELIWPKGKMPHYQEKQIAAMLDETKQKDFNAQKHRTAYLEWYQKPEQPNGG